MKAKINIAKTAGFCFGVKNALYLVQEILKKKKTVYMLGDIVHNEDVVKNLQEAGVKKIKKLKSSGEGKLLLIRAHGAPQKVYREARNKGYHIIDATCPMVKEIHRIAKNAEKKGYKVIVIGDKRHDEVKGILGNLHKRAIVISPQERLNLEPLRRFKKIAVVVQSTQNEEEVIRLLGRLRRVVAEVKFFNTICNPTRLKQQEIRKLPRENDVVIVIGSKTSANTRRLYAISKSINKCTYWIQRAHQIRKNWLLKAGRIGITAGSSTPQETIDRVIDRIKKINL